MGGVFMNLWVFVFNECKLIDGRQTVIDSLDYIIMTVHK